MTTNNISFNILLNEYLNSNENSDNICLITKEPLLNDKVTLPCNHSFNYEPLYNEIIQQKKVKNTYEIVILNKSQIKCPYCRAIHNCLLPYNRKFQTFKNIMEKKLRIIKKKDNNCLALIKTGPNKGTQCNRKCEKQLCNIHKKIIL